ncbi:MAG: UDP-glucose 4-epimerase GalE [Gammaproteobacteria bacterium]|nr:UDP-glucose 4-epimerase GalE [Gammaproteobacteria bacterium]
MKALVVGGAGYIGSHMVKHLCRSGVQVTVLDNLSSGYREAVVASAELVVGSAADANLLASLFARHRFDAVLHFASFIQVGESVADPAKYYANNVATTLTLLDAMRQADVRHFIFSSTAAVYGEPSYVPIDETHSKNPISPYGRSKWIVEQVLEDYDRAYGLKSVCLRYFNAAGADPEKELGERHVPETHLIPLVLQAASGRREAISVFGTDYDTPDGTCIRDYIHVADLCDAHALALDYLLAGGASMRFNLGNGQGFSVQEVIDTARRITGRKIAVRYEARRPGDPARLVADSRLARDVLGWKPKRAELTSIIADAWGWEQKWPW